MDGQPGDPTNSIDLRAIEAFENFLSKPRQFPTPSSTVAVFAITPLVGPTAAVAQARAEPVEFEDGYR
jgi:hypothetical protein